MRGRRLSRVPLMQHNSDFRLRGMILLQPFSKLLCAVGRYGDHENGLNLAKQLRMAADVDEH